MRSCGALTPVLSVRYLPVSRVHARTDSCPAPAGQWGAHTGLPQFLLSGTPRLVWHAGAWFRFRLRLGVGTPVERESLEVRVAPRTRHEGRERLPLLVHRPPEHSREHPWKEDKQCHRDWLLLNNARRTTRFHFVHFHSLVGFFSFEALVHFSIVHPQIIEKKRVKPPHCFWKSTNRITFN